MTKSQTWHEERKGAITATSVAAIMGLSPWQTALDVYLDKISEEIDDTDNENMARGRRAERYVLETYIENTGYTLEVNLPTLTHPKYSFMKGNIDARVKGQNIIVEAKSSKSTSWNELPIYYKTQVAFYAMISNAERVDIPVLFSGWEYGCFSYYRDPEFEKEIEEAVCNFWNNHVIPRIPPPAQNLEDMVKLYPVQEQGKIIVNDNKNINIIVFFILRTQEDIKALEQEIEESKLRLMEYMKDAEELDCGSIGKVTWKAQKTNRLNIKAIQDELPEVYQKYLNESESRVFRIKGAKE